MEDTLVALALTAFFGTIGFGVAKALYRAFQDAPQSDGATTDQRVEPAGEHKNATEVVRETAQQAYQLALASSLACREYAAANSTGRRVASDDLFDDLFDVLTDRYLLLYRHLFWRAGESFLSERLRPSVMMAYIATTGAALKPSLPAGREKEYGKFLAALEMRAAAFDDAYAPLPLANPPSAAAFGGQEAETAFERFGKEIAGRWGGSSDPNAAALAQEVAIKGFMQLELPNRMARIETLSSRRSDA